MIETIYQYLILSSITKSKVSIFPIVVIFLRGFVPEMVVPSYVAGFINSYIHIYIYICWFNFDALAQINSYNPTKEPMGYRGPGGDRTGDLQTDAIPPAASCPARSLHATEIVSINTIPMTCPRLHWTTDNPSGMHGCQFQHLCVLILNSPLALAIYIFVGLILMLWHKEMHINPQRIGLSWIRSGYTNMHTYMHAHTHSLTQAHIHTYIHTYEPRQSWV